MTHSGTTILGTPRILVTLDTSARGRAALRAALQLALTSSAELQGLFVEDEELVRFASLPFAREVDLSSASARQLHAGGMEGALRVAAEEAQRAFATALRHVDVQWSFRVVRGALVQAALAEARDVDLLVIGQQGRSPRAIASEYLRVQTERRQLVVAAFDGSPSAFQTLEVASRFTQGQSNALCVLAITKNGDDVPQKCLAWLQERGIRANVDRALHATGEDIIMFVRRQPLSLFLINRDSEFVNDEQIRRLVNECDCPLGLVRKPVDPPMQ